MLYEVITAIADQITEFREEFIHMREVLLFRKNVRNVMILEEVKVLAGQIVRVRNNFV